MERIENIGFGNLKLIQNSDMFCYGIDAVILADFAFSINHEFRFAVDLGTGNGIIPFVLGHKNEDAKITGIDVQPECVELAQRSNIINGTKHRINFCVGDVLDYKKISFPYDKVDVIVCNPPYFKKGGAIPNSNLSKYIARHEVTATIEDFVKAAAYILGGKGDFFLVHRPSRMVDIFYYCRLYGLEPKTVRFVAPRQGEAPNIVLIHCRAGAGSEIKFLKDLYVYNDDKTYSDEINKIYERI